VELLAKKVTELGYSCFYIHAKMLQVRGEDNGERMTDGETERERDGGDERASGVSRFFVSLSLLALVVTGANNTRRINPTNHSLKLQPNQHQNQHLNHTHNNTHT